MAWTDNAATEWAALLTSRLLDKQDIASLKARVSALEGPPIPPAPSGVILWKATHEAGDLREWYAPGPVGTPNNKPSGAGGAEFDSGGYSPTVVVNDPLGLRGKVAKMQIDTSGGEAGVRLFRFLEPENDASLLKLVQGPGLYYSSWYLIPSFVSVNSWWGLMQWKSAGLLEGDNPIFILTVHSSANGMFLWTERASFSKLPGLPAQKSTIPLPVNRWFQLEAFYKGRSDGTGRITVWQDGAQVADFMNVQTRYADGDPGWSLLDYGAGLSPNPTIVYADDCVISTARAAQSA